MFTQPDVCLWLYSPILGLGRLHETFRFISVTRSRTVRQYSLDGWSARRKASANCPGWLWWWRNWWNERFLQGKPKYSEKTCPDATFSTKNPTCQTRARTPAAAVGSQRLTALAKARPLYFCILRPFLQGNTSRNILHLEDAIKPIN
jgi:hypothetical protein